MLVRAFRPALQRVFGVEVAHAVAIQVIHLELLLHTADGSHAKAKLYHSQEIHDQEREVDACHGEESVAFVWSAQEKGYGEDHVDEGQRKLHRGQHKTIQVVYDRTDQHQ